MMTVDAAAVVIFFQGPAAMAEARGPRPEACGRRPRRTRMPVEHDGGQRLTAVEQSSSFLTTLS